jgi:hypothetical protein
MNEHFGQHPVTYADFKVVTGDSFNEVLLNFREVLSMAFKQHDYVLKCREFWSDNVWLSKEICLRYMLMGKCDHLSEVEMEVIRGLCFFITSLIQVF